MKLTYIYLYPKMNFVGQGFCKLEHYRQTDRQTDKWDQKHYQAA